MGVSYLRALAPFPARLRPGAGTRFAHARVLVPAPFCDSHAPRSVGVPLSRGLSLGGWGWGAQAGV